MGFSIPAALSEELDGFKIFLNRHLKPNLSAWYKKGEVSLNFYNEMGKAGWYGFRMEGHHLVKNSALRESLIQEELAKLSPGVAVAVLAHINLGLTGLFLFGSEDLQKKYGEAAVNGETLMCVGNSENKAGSDVAGISMRADKVEGGWRLNGAKAYVTNGLIADLAVITAVSDPQASRNSRNDLVEGVRPVTMGHRYLGLPACIGNAVRRLVGWRSPGLPGHEPRYPCPVARPRVPFW